MTVAMKAEMMAPPMVGSMVGSTADQKAGCSVVLTADQMAE